MKNGGVASLANRPGYSFGSKVLKKFGPVGNFYNKGLANIKKGPQAKKGYDPDFKAKQERKVDKNIIHGKYKNKKKSWI